MRKKEILTLELSSDLNYAALTRKLNEFASEIRKRLKMPKTTLQVVVVELVDKR
jgi:hypothetical protein